MSPHDVVPQVVFFHPVDKFFFGDHHPVADLKRGRMYCKLCVPPDAGGGCPGGEIYFFFSAGLPVCRVGKSDFERERAEAVSAMWALISP